MLGDWNILFSLSWAYFTSSSLPREADVEKHSYFISWQNTSGQSVFGICELIWKLIHLFHLKLFLPAGNFLRVSHISSFSCLFSWSSSLSPACLSLTCACSYCWVLRKPLGSKAFPGVWSPEEFQWMYFVNPCAGNRTGSVLVLYRQFLAGIRRRSSPLWERRTKKSIQFCLFKHCRVELGRRIKWEFPLIGLVQPG